MGIYQCLIRCDKAYGCEERIFATKLILLVVLYFITLDFARGYFNFTHIFQKMCVIFIDFSNHLGYNKNRHTIMLLLCVNFI